MNRLTYFVRNNKPAVKLHTVNVVEYADGTLQSIRSFVDNECGNKRAEKLFLRCVKENSDPLWHEQEDLDAMIEDGTFEEGTYQVFLCHGI